MSRTTTITPGRYVFDAAAGIFRPVPMGAEGTGDPPADPKPDPKPDPSGDGKVLTQDEVNRIAAREKREGRDAAMREVADELGVDVATAKQIITAANEAAEAQKTEAQRAADAAAQRERDAEAREQAAAREIHTTRVERALHAAGYDPTEDEDGVKLARIRRMVTVEPGAEYADVVADVTQIVDGFPALFGAATTAPPLPGKIPSTTAPGVPPKSKGDASSAMDRGAERAKQYAATTGVSYGAKQ